MSQKKKRHYCMQHRSTDWLNEIGWNPARPGLRCLKCANTSESSEAFGKIEDQPKEMDKS